METSAFSYYGLGDIEQTLDHIADKASELASIDEIIARVSTVTNVIVPTDQPLRPVIEGTGPSIEHGHIPHLKTLLFVLANEFEIDIHDSKQVQIVSGGVDDQMIREESYYSVDIPKLERTVLVCDEERNATFVMNSMIMDEVGISSEDLINITKSDLCDLLQDKPELGVKLKHTSRFVPRLVEAIENPVQKPSHHRPAESLSYLYPKAPADVLSMSAIAEKLGIYRPTVAAVITELEETLDKPSLYRFGTNVVAPGFTSEQQASIEKRLEEKGCLVDKAPDGILSAHGIALELSVDRNTILRAVKALEDELGEIQKYKFGGQRTQGFDQEQQLIIFDHLEKKGVFQTQASENYRSASGIAKDLGTTHGSVSKAIEALGNELGEMVSQKFGKATTIAYSPEQQNQIHERLFEMGIMSEQAPDEIVSVNGLAKQLGVSRDVVGRAIAVLGDELGKTNKYRFNMVISVGLDSEQQRIINEYLADRGVLTRSAPDGFNTVKSIAIGLKVDSRVVKRAVDELDEALGDTAKYRFGSACATGYSPVQQEQIIEHMRIKGVLSEQAPENIVSASRLMRELKIGEGAIRQALDAMSKELGEVRQYKFGGVVADGYDLAQQETIRQWVSSSPSSHAV
jgi:biotin operon repressor